MNVLWEFDHHLSSSSVQENKRINKQLRASIIHSTTSNMQAKREGIKNSISPFYLSLALKRQDTFLPISLYE